MPDIHPYSNEEAAMGFEGDPVVSTVPAVEDVPLLTLETFEIEPEETDVPVAQFQSSV